MELRHMTPGYLALAGSTSSGSRYGKRQRLSDVLESYLADRPVLESTAAQYRRNLARCVPDWLDKPCSAITEAMVLARHKKISATMPPLADNCFRILRAAFAYHLTELADDPEGCNPVDVLTLKHCWNGVVTTDEAVDLERVGELFNSFHYCHHTIRDLLIFLLLSGLRLSEATHLRREDFDHELSLVRVGERQLPLSPYLTELLGQRLKHQRGVYIFPSKFEDKPATSPYQAIRAIRQNTGIVFSPETLRKTFFACVANRKGTSENLWRTKMQNAPEELRADVDAVSVYVLGQAGLKRS